MTFTISKRGLVRLVSFVLAIALVLSLLAWNAYGDARQSRRALEYRYMQSVSDLTTYVQNIDSDLEKAMYAKTPAMLTNLSTKLWREAGYAKESLDSLPISYLELQNTNKFLSQVGDYCVSLSREFEKGNQITAEQRANLLKLSEYCDTMLTEVLAVNDGIQTGSISLTEVREEVGGAPAPASVAEGFSEFEEGFTAYPSLIYDGPFSDHIMERQPEKLKGAAEVSRADALKKASKVSGIAQSQLKEGGDEEGKMPSYAFTADGTDISITKQGGYLSYLLRSRTIETRKLSVSDALKKAQEYLDGLGVQSLRVTYYEITGNLMTINYAYTQDGVLMYTDLVKVSIALDNGEVMAFDARGFLTNSHQRDGLTPKLTKEQARSSVSELLTIDKVQLCVIPSSGLNEVLCWEFKCKADDGQDVLVYVNANTGAEEQILILIISENGQLTI